MKIKNHILRKITFLVFVLIVITGCKTTFKTFKNERVLFNQTVLQEISDSFLSYDTFSAKLKIGGDFQGNKRPLKGIIRIRKDSVIWVSVNLSSGIPIAKMIFTRDSVKYLDRVKDVLYVGDYKYFNSRFNIEVNYYLLESVLLNEFVICNGHDKVIIDRTIEETDKSYGIKCVVTEEDQTVFNIDYIVDKEIKKIMKTVFEVGNSKYNISYSMFSEIEGVLYPGLFTVFIDGQEKDLNLDMEVSKVNLNRKQKYPFKISKKVKTIKE